MNGRLSCLFVVLPSVITIIIILYILHHDDEEVCPWTPPTLHGLALFGRRIIVATRCAGWWSRYFIRSLFPSSLSTSLLVVWTMLPQDMWMPSLSLSISVTRARDNILNISTISFSAEGLPQLIMRKVLWATNLISLFWVIQLIRAV